MLYLINIFITLYFTLCIKILPFNMNTKLFMVNKILQMNVKERIILPLT
jgi:hypothetical protein